METLFGFRLIALSQSAAGQAAAPAAATSAVSAKVGGPIEPTGGGTAMPPEVLPSSAALVTEPTGFDA